MTITRKVGAILLLLTAGSLVGSATFGLFFARTSSDGLFLVAANVKHSLLQELSIEALRVRTGDETARERLEAQIARLTSLVEAMTAGGTETQAGRGESPLSLANRLYAIAGNADRTASLGTQQLAVILARDLPVPPADVQVASSEFAVAWNRLKPEFSIVAARPANDPLATEAYRKILADSSELNQKSWKVSAAVGLRIGKQRSNVMALLILIAALSLVLFGVGLWFTRRYVTAPIQELKKSSMYMREGDFSHRIAIVSHDEMGSLSTAFNEMSEEICRLVDRYRELFENAADFIYTTDLDGNFLSVNRAGESITGFGRAELQKMQLGQIMAPEQSEVPRLMREQLRSQQKETAVAEMEYIARDGRHLFMDTSMRLIYENGIPIAFQGVSRDITERKKLQDQLWTAQKMDAIGRMAGGIAHDFGNVLTIITGYCALILATRPADDPVSEDVKGIQKAAERAAALIRHLLGFCSGQIFRPRVILPESALREMADMLRRLIGEDIELITDIPDDLCPIRIDPDQLEQIIINLVLNARDAMPGGGVLRIEAANVKAPSPHLRLSVRDTGIGMTPETTSKIFEPFFSMKEHGTGLGLSNVHSIIRQSEGSIAVDSRIGEGTTFTMSFPCTVRGDEAEAIRAVQTPQRGTETILLVEDEAGVRQLIRDMLRFYGYNVVEAENQRHALDLCSRHEVKLDLLLSDVLMPSMSGPEMVKQVLQIRPDLKVIYMSGHSRDRLSATGLNLDLEHFIQKPVVPEFLTARIRKVLGE